MLSKRQDIALGVMLLFVLATLIVTNTLWPVQEEPVVTTEKAIVETTVMKTVLETENTVSTTRKYEEVGNEQSHEFLGRHMKELFVMQETTESTTTTQETIKPTTVQTTIVVQDAGNDRKLFEQIVSAEAHPKWGFEGYYLIARTVMNQLEEGYWGNSLRKVLTYRGNYSVYSSGRYLTVAVSDKAVKAVDYALRGEVPNTLNDFGSGTNDVYEVIDQILYFCTMSHLNRTPSGFHAKQDACIQYDNVMFFRKKN